MKLFVWDFHGVLEKGNEDAVVEISNNVLKDFGYSEQFDHITCHALYGKKWYEYFEHLLPHEPYERHYELQEACKAGRPFDIICQHIQPNDYALEVLDRIHNQHTQVLLSNTPPWALTEFIKVVNMGGYFADHNSFGVDSHHKKHR